jgi:molybdate transport system permease protein
MMGLSADDLGAIALSLRVAAVATLFTLPVATALALLLARRQFPGKALVDAAVHLPLVVPPVATGFALLVLFGHNGIVGRVLERVGIVFAFDWTGAALAAGVMAFPLMVRPIRLSIEAIDREVDEVARTLGARPWVRFITVTAPLATPGIAAGMVLGFAKALGEFGATITFVAAIPGETLTLPSAIYQATQSPGLEGRAVALCLVSATLAVVAVVASEIVSRALVRRLEQGVR